MANKPGHPSITLEDPTNICLEPHKVLSEMTRTPQLNSVNPQTLETH